MQETLPLRFVGYVRVSTEEQARSGLSIQAQRERLHGIEAPDRRLPSRRSGPDET